METLAAGGVGEAKIRVPDGEVAAGLQRTGEAGEGGLEGLEAEVALAGEEGGILQRGVLKDGHAEDRIVAAGRFVGGGILLLKDDAGIAGGGKAPAAERDIAGVDIDPLDRRVREVAAEREDFVAGGAAERQDARRGRLREAVGDEGENPGIAIGESEAAILEEIGRRAEPHALIAAKGAIDDAMPSEPERAIEREATQGGFEAGEHGGRLSPSRRAKSIFCRGGRRAPADGRSGAWRCGGCRASVAQQLLRASKSALAPCTATRGEAPPFWGGAGIGLSRRSR